MSHVLDRLHYTAPVNVTQTQSLQFKWLLERRRAAVHSQPPPQVLSSSLVNTNNKMPTGCIAGFFVEYVGYYISISYVCYWHHGVPRNCKHIKIGARCCCTI